MEGRKRRRIVAAAAGLMTGMLLLCGFRMHPAVQPAEEDGPQTVQPTVRVFSISAQDTFAAVRRAMQEERGIKIECESHTLEEEEAMVCDLRAGIAEYDVLHLGYGMMYEYDTAALIDGGYLQPLTRPVVRKAVDNMWQPLQKLALQEESVYVLPVAASTYNLCDPQNRSVSTWAEYLENNGSTRWMHGLWHCLLKQYMMDCHEAEFAFDRPMFEETLELAKRSYNDHREESRYDFGDERYSLHVEMGGVARIERDGALSLAASGERIDWLPSIDGAWRLPLDVGVLAIPTGAKNTELAQDVVARMASFGLYGDNSLAIEGTPYYYFGAPSAESCYDLPAQISFCVGDRYPENRQTWAQLMQNAELVPEVDFLSAAFEEEIRPYFEGEMTTAECMQRVQEMWENR